MLYFNFIPRLLMTHKATDYDTFLCRHSVQITYSLMCLSALLNAIRKLTSQRGFCRTPARQLWIGSEGGPGGYIRTLTSCCQSTARCARWNAFSIAVQCPQSPALCVVGRETQMANPRPLDLVPISTLIIVHCGFNKLIFLSTRVYKRSLDSGDKHAFCSGRGIAEWI